MLASLFGAIIGGMFALVGGWLALEWQTQREARGVASALLAELTLSERLLEEGGSNRAFYQTLIDEWKATGTVQHPQAIADMFDSDPQESLPVYYAMAGKLGLLPERIAADVVAYHAKIIALPRMVVRFLGRQRLEKSFVKGIAAQVETQFHESTEMRAKLIKALRAFVDKPIRSIPFQGM